MKTKLLYLTDSYQTTTSAKIVSITTKGNQTQVVLDQTIFYPQGGGQPSDIGTITGSDGSLNVSRVSLTDTQVVHSGKLSGTLNPDDQVTLNLDWQTRYSHMQAHTAGHLLDEAVKSLYPEIYGTKGCHGIDQTFYITFSGLIDATHKPIIQSTLEDIIKNAENITTQLTTKAKIDAQQIFVPFKLPDNKPLRLLTVGARPPVPDGGTQLKNTAEAWPITLIEFEYHDGQTDIHYQLHPPVPKSPSKTTPRPNSTISLEKLKQESAGILNQAKSVQAWDEAARTRFLGKKGLFNTSLAPLIKAVSIDDKAAAGQILNQTKHQLEHLAATSEITETKVGEWLDLTAPGTLPPIGHLHPITQAIQEITGIFKGLGFTRVRYPEVDYDYYVFEALNMPSNHPARDEWETFFIDAPKHPKKGQLVLTTHTSNGQVREMERVKQPPIRMLNLGKCYRRQQDVTHTAMFHQFEGLVIDRGITIGHLKGTLDYFARKFYGSSAKSRIRPFMFKFTEPSFEVDFSCTHCQGTGLQGKTKCRFCKSGWHEVGGAGMVHPNVLKAGGIDPEVYTGFAFGWGVERVYTLKPGLHLDDIRPLYSTNLQFLNQF